MVGSSFWIERDFADQLSLWRDHVDRNEMIRSQELVGESVQCLSLMGVAVESVRLTRFILITIASLVLIGIGFVIGSIRGSSTVAPQVVSGKVTKVGIDGNEFAFVQNGSHATTSYGLSSSIEWRDTQGSWSDSSSIACMRPLSNGQSVTLGVVTVKPTNGAPGGPVVVWLECLP